MKAITTPLLVLVSALLTQCGDRELNSNDKMSQESFVKEMKAISAAVPTPPAPVAASPVMSMSENLQ